jgi:hypothetical protein
VGLERILEGFGHGSLSVNDGFLSGDFQKVVQVLLQLGESFRCGYIEIELISDFLDLNRETDFVELINEVVDFTSSCGF